jgi:predicted amidohydrolase/acetyl esterase/lipase
MVGVATWWIVAIPVNSSEPSAPTIRVAAISFVPQPLDLEGTARQLEAAFRKAAEGGARIAVAPEGVLEGYIINHILRGEIAAEKLREVAIPVDHALIQRFQSLARELRLCLVFGFAERIGTDVYNTAIFIDDQGNVCGKYHKMQLDEGYHPDWWFNRLGTTSRAFDTPFGRCGILICNDRWNPLLARIPMLDGAQFLVIPSYGSTSKEQDEEVLARSRETGLPVIEANVGVTLIASGGTVQAIERESATITFADIEIPDSVAPRESERNQAEQEFLRWRAAEMPLRYARRMEQIGKSRTGNGAPSQPRVIDVWPGTPPDEPGTIGAEYVRMSPELTPREVEVTQSTRMITNVTKPTLTIYRPPPTIDAGTSMLICPGGGYWNLYWELEGEEVAAWLISRGITGIIVKYRVPRRPDEVESEPARRPLQDAQRAIRLVRSHARDWGLHPERIGIIGFSAGGHLAISAATEFDRRAYKAIDGVDGVSCRPDFAVAAYSGYLKAKDETKLAPGLRVPPRTPPIFLVHGGSDPISPPAHSVVMYLALQQAGVPTELHIYASTTHDFGIRVSGRPYGRWTDACERWLSDQKLLMSKTAQTDK